MQKGKFCDSWLTEPQDQMKAMDGIIHKDQHSMQISYAYVLIQCVDAVTGMCDAEVQVNLIQNFQQQMQPLQP